jgi:hypothetical protein
MDHNATGQYQGGIVLRNPSPAIWMELVGQGMPLWEKVPPLEFAWPLLTAAIRASASVINLARIKASGLNLDLILGKSAPFIFKM